MHPVQAGFHLRGQRVFEQTVYTEVESAKSEQAPKNDLTHFCILDTQCANAHTRQSFSSYCQRFG